MKGNVFIKRPVMAISISVLILAIGLISLFTLPVEQYPDIAPPTVYVTASYTGADAEAVMNSVIMPLEESINGVEDMMYISSSASNAGLAIIQVYFKQGTDPDMAAVNVQNRVAGGVEDAGTGVRYVGHDADHLQVIHKADRIFAGTFQAESDHATSPVRHVFLCQIVIFVAL